MKRSSMRLSDHLKTWAAILVGNALLAFLVSAFVVPHGFIMAGTTGIGIVVSGLLPVDMSLVVLILNVILLLFGLLALGKRFFVTTVASSLLYPMFLALMQRIPGIETLTSDPLLAALYGGVLLGVALGLVMRVGSSTGGTDVISLVMQKWFHWPLSICVWIVDITVLSAQLPFSNMEEVLYGIVILVLETLVLDQVMILGQSQVQVMVISQQYEAVRKKLLTDLQAGVTMMYIETGHVGEQQKGVLCIIPPRKVFDAKEMIYDIDPEAFLTITRIQEVRGRGFSIERKEDSEQGEKAKGKRRIK